MNKKSAAQHVTKSSSSSSRHSQSSKSQAGRRTGASGLRSVNLSNSPADGLATLQRLAGNAAVNNLIGAPVQRLIDGFYAGGATKVPTSRIALTAAFKKKHVAADEAAARSITGARIDEGKPPAMVQGRLGNTTATEAQWIDAIDKSQATIPDQDAWSGGLAVKVTGWEAKRTGPRSITISPLADAARTVGGFMKKKGGKVDVDHVSGQTS
jgi:hypothetical protein